MTVLSVLLLSIAAVMPAGVPVDGIVAVVGSVPILYSDVVSLLQESGVVHEEARGMYHGDPLYDAALAELIQEKLLVEAARREGLYPTPTQVNERVDFFIAERRTEFPTETAFQQALSASGLTLATYREVLAGTIEHRLAAENYARRISGAAGLTLPSDPAVYLSENIEAFREVMGLANLEWIYLPVIPGNTGEAELLLIQVRGRIESGETTFDVMAMEYSQDATARVGGDLDWFDPGDMTPAFEARVAGLQAGEMAGPFVTPFGVHLVMLTERDGDRLRASHILRLVPVQPHDVQRVLDTAEAVRASVISGEVLFSEAAAEYSLDPTTRFEGGSLGTVFLAGWDASLAEMVSALSPGGLSDPVQIERGSAVALFRLTPDQTPDFSGFTPEDLESVVSSFLWQRAFNETVDSLEAEIPVFYPGLE
ncbi:MAG: peptidylprolyl isomerase [Candidatus Fermentibacteraceae bacterium]